MKIKDIIVSDGKKRTVIGFCTVEGAEQPITEPYNEENSNGGEFIINENKVTETKETVEQTATIIYSCQFCGKELADANRLASHERLCGKNPESKNYKGE